MSAAETQYVIAVVVTHNRYQLLTEALAAIQHQTRPPDHVLVIDNASTDGTAAAIRERFSAVELLTLRTNAGGAGGFATGVAHALAEGADHLWIMDDDTIPQAGALAALLDARQQYAGEYSPAIVASRVVWTDGRDHPMNTPRQRPFMSNSSRMAAAGVGCTSIRSASFVSVLVDGDIVRASGLPLADYFLWNDDFEFTARLLRHRIGLYNPASLVVHKTRNFGAIDADPGERFFYEVRNKLWLFRRSSSLAPLERGLYACSTMRRWTRTFSRSADRATLRRALWRGVRAGLVMRPSSTEAVMRDLDVPLATVEWDAHGARHAELDVTGLSSREKKE